MEICSHCSTLIPTLHWLHTGVWLYLNASSIDKGGKSILEQIHYPCGRRSWFQKLWLLKYKETSWKHLLSLEIIKLRVKETPFLRDVFSSPCGNGHKQDLCMSWLNVKVMSIGKNCQVYLTAALGNM